MAFIKNHQEVDVLCLQEVYKNAEEKISGDDRKVYLNIFEQIQASLPNYQGYFSSEVNDCYGVAMFVSNNIDVISENKIVIHKNPEYKGIGPAHSRNLQSLSIQINEKTINIVNVHCLWNGRGKFDSPEQATTLKRSVLLTMCWCHQKLW